MKRIALTLLLTLTAAATAVAQNEIPRADEARLRGIMSEALAEYRRTAEGNPAGQANYEHVARMLEAIEARSAELRRIGANPLAVQAGILFSDLGKGGPRMEALARELFPREFANNRGAAMFRAFLLHEIPGRQEFLERARAAGLSPATIRAVEAANIGHNGPSARGSFWQGAWDANVREFRGEANLEGRHGALAREYLGRAYPSVGSINGAIHAGLDRRDQGTRDGSLKILGELVGRGSRLNEAFREAFSENQRKTLLQFEQLRSRYPQIFQLDIVSEAERAVRETTRYGNHVYFDRTGNRARVHLADGRIVQVSTPAELTEVLRTIENPSNTRVRNNTRAMNVERFRQTERSLNEARSLAARTIPELVRELRSRGLRPEGALTKTNLIAQLTGVPTRVATNLVNASTTRGSVAGAPPRSRGFTRTIEGLAPNSGRATRARGR